MARVRWAGTAPGCTLLNRGLDGLAYHLFSGLRCLLGALFRRDFGLVFAPFLILSVVIRPLDLRYGEGESEH